MEALGIELTLEDQNHVLRSYVHRYTAEHRPTWVIDKINPVQFSSDADWLAHTKFKVRKNGRLDHRFHTCHSSPTWPQLKTHHSSV